MVDSHILWIPQNLPYSLFSKSFWYDVTHTPTFVYGWKNDEKNSDQYVQCRIGIKVIFSKKIDYIWDVGTPCMYGMKKKIKGNRYILNMRFVFMWCALILISFVI